MPKDLDSDAYPRASLAFQPSFSPPENGTIISQKVDHFSGGIPLEQEKAQGKAGKIAEALVKTDLVILPSRQHALHAPAG